MSGFSTYSIGQWRDGEASRCEIRIFCVHYDQRSYLYYIDTRYHTFEEFQEWVAQTWEIDRDLRKEDEEAEDYLDRVGVSVREWEIGQ